MDLDDKTQWFLDLVETNGAKAECPCALIKKADGTAEFVKDTTVLLSRLAPSKGEGLPVSDTDVMPGLMMPWFGYQASVPVLIRDMRDEAKAAAKQEKLAGYVDKLRPLEATCRITSTSRVVLRRAGATGALYSLLALLY